MRLIYEGRNGIASVVVPSNDFLDTLTGQKISVGPPYYNFILASFLLPLLFLMTSGPKHKWISSNVIGIFNIALFTSIILFFVIFLSTKEGGLLLLLILLFSTYLITQPTFDFYQI